MEGSPENDQWLAFHLQPTKTVSQNIPFNGRQVKNIFPSPSDGERVSQNCSGISMLVRYRKSKQTIPCTHLCTSLKINCSSNKAQHGINEEVMFLIVNRGILVNKKHRWREGKAQNV